MRIISAPVVSPIDSPSAPAADVERVTALERIVQSLQEKILALEGRLHRQESAPPPIPASTPRRISPGEVTWDAEAVKKNLLAKMWKYLNDDPRPPKAV